MGGGGGTTVSNAASASAGPMMQAFNTGQQSVLDMGFTHGVPENYEVSPAELERMMQTQTGIYQADTTEEQYDPEMAKIRAGVKSQIASRLEGVDPLLQRELARLGAIKAIQSGAEGDRATAVMQNLYGRSYDAWRQQQLERAANYSSNVPKISTRLSPEQLIAAVEGNKQTALANRNNRRAALLGLGQQAASNFSNYGTGLMQGVITESGQNTASMNQSSAAGSAQKGQLFGAGMGMVGTIGAAAATAAIAA